MQWLVRTSDSISQHELTLAGWLGSYGGEDSTSDISRGEILGDSGRVRSLTHRRSLGRNSGNATPSEALREVQHQSNLVYSWYSTRQSKLAAIRSRPQVILSKLSPKTVPPYEMPATRLVSMATRTKTLSTCLSNNNAMFLIRPTKC
jgi:hypothetical protein